MAGTWWYYEIDGRKIVQRNSELRKKEIRASVSGEIYKSRKHYDVGIVLTTDAFNRRPIIMVKLPKDFEPHYLFIDMGEAKEIWLTKEKLTKEMANKSPEEYQNYLVWIKKAKFGDLFMFHKGWIVVNKEKISYAKGYGN